MNLFQFGDFTLSNGERSTFKIDCDALTDADWECIAYLLSLRLPAFGRVEGVPRGGLKLAEKMARYATLGNLLIVDDVLTSGRSLLTYAMNHANGSTAIGAVVFARGRIPMRVTALFSMGAEIGA